MDNDIFCKIINKEIQKEFIYESESIVVFPDINPSTNFLVFSSIFFTCFNISFIIFHVEMLEPPSLGRAAVAF